MKLTQALFIAIMAMLMVMPLPLVGQQSSDKPKVIVPGGGGVQGPTGDAGPQGETGPAGPAGSAGAAGAAGADGAPYADLSWFYYPNIGATPTTASPSVDGATNAWCTQAKTQKITTAVTMRWKTVAVSATIMTWEEIGIGYVSSIPQLTGTTTLTVATAIPTTKLSVGTGLKTETFSSLTIPAGVHLCALFSQNGDGSAGTLTGADSNDPLQMGNLKNDSYRPTVTSSGTFTGVTGVAHAIVALIPTW